MKRLFIVAATLFALGCERKLDSPEQPALIAGRHAVERASADGVDFNSFSLRSINFLGYGEQSVVRRVDTSPQIEEVRRKLDRRWYWEACFGVSSPQLVGAKYCYYFDEASYELLATYRLK